MVGSFPCALAGTPETSCLWLEGEYRAALFDASEVGADLTQHCHRSRCRCGSGELSSHPQTPTHEPRQLQSVAPIDETIAVL